VVVQTDDALLVLDRAEAQDVKPRGRAAAKAGAMGTDVMRVPLPPESADHG